MELEGQTKREYKKARWREGQRWENHRDRPSETQGEADRDEAETKRARGEVRREQDRENLKFLLLCCYPWLERQREIKGGGAKGLDREKMRERNKERR